MTNVALQNCMLALEEQRLANDYLADMLESEKNMRLIEAIVNKRLSEICESLAYKNSVYEQDGL